METRPILFKTEMVQAILDGRKTQTRRIIKPQPWEVMPRKTGERPRPYEFVPYDKTKPKHGDPHEIKCPYGNPGDQLWVREAWRVHSWSEYEPINIVFRDGKTFECVERGMDDGFMEWEERLVQQSCADMEKAGWRCRDGEEVYSHEDENAPFPTRWRPSIHMPRWASRITLNVTDVRVDKLREITADDCEAEGLQLIGPEHLRSMLRNLLQQEFADLWDGVNKDHPWKSNPWVWVVSFTQTQNEE